MPMWPNALRRRWKPQKPPELMTPPEQESWSEHVRKQFKDWLRYLTNETNSL